MNRKDRIKLSLTRNWKFPGKERLSNLFRPSELLKTSFSDGIVWLTDENIAINTSADNFIEWAILSGGTYEEEIAKVIRFCLKPGSVALDIGANIGLQSLRMSDCVGPTGRVYAFEPLNYLRVKFERNAALNLATNITIFPYALSDAESEAFFKIDSKLWNQGTFSLLNQNEGNEEQKVEIKIADNLPEIQALDSLDLIKIDVEGFEFQVILGLRETLTRFKPRLIFEYDSNYWVKTKQSIDECYLMLASMNYLFYQITQVGCELIKDAGAIEDGNLLCIQAN